MHYAYVSSSTQKTEARNQSSKPSYTSEKVQNWFSYLRKDIIVNYIKYYYIVNIFIYYCNLNIKTHNICIYYICLCIYVFIL